ncbi:MAG: ABC-F family ATP-binding cassette domain-containing protein [Candidatus Cyclobacteriaceae bacterium M3_2C_046]
MNYLSVEGISKSFGEKNLFQDLSFGINQGEKVALIGINGSGKSTLFNIIAGVDTPDTGQVVFRNDILIEYLEQNPVFDQDWTVGDAIFSGDNEMIRLVRQYEDCLALSQKDNSHQDELQQLMMQMDRLNAWNLESQVQQILGKLGIYSLDLKVSQLSGGQKKRVALAKTLIQNPDFILLDEPTNHLDLDVIEWLEKYLSSQNTTLLLVTHDRYFLESITNQIFELERGQIYNYKGSYSYYLEKKAERQSLQAKEVEKAQNLMRKELDWVRRQPKARGSKAKYRLDAFEDLKDKAQQKLDQDQLNLSIASKRQGKKIMEVKNLKKSYGQQVILNQFTYTFKRNDRIGIIGKNGSGKTTLLNLITGHLQPDQGEIDKGLNTQMGYYTQQEIAFDPAKKVIDVVTEVAEIIKISNGSVITASQFLQQFQFSPEMQYDFVEKLSGGEKRRLQLLLVLIKSPNFLILDEPTNDLDILTLNILEEYLEQFDGCLMIVSHDRYFMDRLVDHLFVFEEGQQIRDFPGNYTDFRMEQEKIQKSHREQKTPIKKEVKPTAPKNKQKMSFNERREFEQLGAQIEHLEQRKQLVLEKLNTGNESHQQLTTWSLEIEAIDQELEQKMDRWLELSELDG